MHRMNANRSTDGTSIALSDQSVQKIQSGMDKAKERKVSSRQQKKTAKKVKAVKPVEPNPQIRIASLNDIPSDFERIGTGFFRRGHHLWELNSEGEGFVLVRKGGEDHVLGYDPEPIVKSASISASVVTDRFGKQLEVGSRVELPHRGKIAQATVYLLSPDSLGLETDGGEQIDAAPDMVQILEELLLPLLADGPLIDLPREEHEEHEEHEEEEHEEEDKKESKDKESSEGFEPDVEPTSKEAWTDYWRDAGRRVAQAKPPTTPKPKTPKLPGQLTPEQKEKRRQTRKERRMMMKGLPPGTKAPPRPKSALSKGDDDERSKDKEYVRICQQLVDELKYILQDEEMQTQPEMLLDHIEQAVESFDEEMEDTNSEDKKDLEDSLSIETPPKEDRTLDDLRSANRVVVSMTEL